MIDGATGADMILVERVRQVDVEGWTVPHDALYLNNELIRAAMSYLEYEMTDTLEPPFSWPWARRWWKPSPDDRVRELIKAGALIAAEIDRLLVEEDA